MSDTPETDGEYNPENGWSGVVPVEHARKLERKRNELIQVLRGLNKLNLCGRAYEEIENALKKYK